MRFAGLFALFSAGVLSATVNAQTIFLVRHAERADAAGVVAQDPELSTAGRARAADLAQTLQDAKIGAIYVSEFRRTRETAQPLADKLGLRPIAVPAKETARLVELLRFAKTNLLVVGHSNTLPEIMRALGVPSPPTIGESEYDNLFLLTDAPNAQLISLHYR